VHSCSTSPVHAVGLCMSPVATMVAPAQQAPGCTSSHVEPAVCTAVVLVARLGCKGVLSHVSNRVLRIDN
jgi:hypothetical protein